MRATAKIALMVIATTFGLASCSKDNVVEFYSTGEWRLDRYYYNSNDNTDDYLQSHQDYILNLKLGNDFTETCILNDAPYGVSGNWEVSNDAKLLRLYDSFNGTREYQINYTSTASLRIQKGVEEWWLKRP